MSKFRLTTRVADDGKPYFTLDSVDNGQTIMTSETYESKSNMNQTINSVNTAIRMNGCFNVVEEKKEV